MNKLRLEDIVPNDNKWRKMASYLGAKENEVDEFMQRMYLKLAEIEHAEGDLERLRGKIGINTFYVFKTLQSCIYDEYKLNKKTSFQEIEISTDRFETAFDLFDNKEKKYKTLMRDVRRTIDGLDEYDLCLLELYYVKGCTMRQIASGVNISTKSVFNTLTNIKRIIKHETGKKFKEYSEAKEDTEETNHTTSGVGRYSRNSDQINRH